MQKWALSLDAELRRRCASARVPSQFEPPHATAPGPTCGSSPLSRALYEVTLVLEDPAAGIHNASFARKLLGDAEEQMHLRETVRGVK
jgi:hypothetical protein